ncbi:ubiquitin conjugation factor E4 A-like [Saccostrea echinata]|uniref:ubiquitin conjugation factor E4 A-like n=1 Tax=Saccostrea echinata TaxID=191078 RepID=UPI002A824225|nr:ubiquitin conjugation factor E4 A-like [Saccostrea echinata]
MSEKRDLTQNPFTALFTSVEDAEQYSAQSLATQSSTPKGNEEKEDDTQRKMAINWMIENVFLITLDKEVHPYEDRPSRCVFMSEMYETLEGQTWWEMANLEQAVFERLLLPNPGADVVNLSNKDDLNAASLAGESEVLRYLYQCYKRQQNLILKKRELTSELGTCCDVILMNARICLQQDELYPSQDPLRQLLDLYEEEACFTLSSEGDHYLHFFDELVQQIEDNAEDGSVPQVFEPMLEHTKHRLFKDFSLLSPGVIKAIDFLIFFTRKPSLAQVFIDHSSPKDWNKGSNFQSTLLGHVFTLSCIPRMELGPYEFFENPSTRTKQDIEATESNIQQPLANMCEKVYQLLFAIIKLSPDLRHKVLQWLGKCIHANLGRTKIWSSQMPQLFTQMYASEGFCLNLCSIMLRLCKPFSEPKSAKLLKIQPTYCRMVAANEKEAKEKGIHTEGLSKESCLVPNEENESICTEENYNFITECFFMTHQCIYMSFHTVHEKFLKLNQELHRVQRLYNEVRGQGNDEVEPVRSIKRQMEKGMTLYLCMKAALTEPRLLEMSLNFHLATATWLSEIAINEDCKTFEPVKFPLPKNVPTVLTCVPEFIMGNVTDFTLFLQRFKEDMYEMAGDKLEHFMTLILVYMGSPERMRNPHLRAELAETLASLLPAESGSSSKGILSWFSREQLFVKHPLIEHLAEKLLNVFVSIEMTGQSVQFEQKFNYRRPMYMVLEHVWEISLHRKCIKKLAEEAEKRIEDTDPPLFLRFINLLINDAIFLLDEAFDYMTQIKDKQAEKDRGEWNNLDQQQRQENENTLRQITMLARYHNMMGNYTIHALELITREIKSIFCHSSMVDRIAGMLNYFLLHLVGPKQRSFNVRDKNEIEFKPQQMVSDITQIYLNLGDNEAFCMAVSADGRSYSPELFQKTTGVLQKIGKSPTMINQVDSLRDKIEVLRERQAEDELLYSDAPDEFLDPIMGTLMRDPVILPSSKNIVDRAVIARHILSDQTDPFNRSPLSLDMVTPDVDLKKRIDSWIQEKKKSS